MKKLRTSTAAKVAAGIITLVCAALVMLCIYAGVTIAEETDLYTADSFESSSLMQDIVSAKVRSLMQDNFYTISDSDIFVSGSDRQQEFISENGEDNCPVAIMVTDADGNLLLQNYEAASPLSRHDYTYYYTVEPDGGYIYYHLDSKPYDPNYMIDYQVFHSEDWVPEGVVRSFEEWLAYNHGDEAVETYRKLVSESDLAVSGSDLETILNTIDELDDSYTWYWSAMYGSYNYDTYNEWKCVSPTDHYSIRATVSSTLTEQKADLHSLDDFGSSLPLTYKLGSFVFRHRFDVIWIGIVSLVLALACFIFLCCAVGWRKGNDKPVRGFFERIPLLLYLGLCLLVFSLIVSTYSSIFSSEEWSILLVALPVCAVAGMLMLLSLITRFKCGRWWETTLTYHIIRLYRRLSKNWSVTWRIIVPTALLFAFNGIMALLGVFESGFFLIMVIVDIAAFFYIITLAMNWGSVVADTARLADGDTSVRIDTAKLSPTLRTHGENINALGEGALQAVEQQLRSERMRTDLITNVSHDLKTPLTSIVNYVGLLKGQQIDNPTAAEYIGVLDRQAVRLKHLVEDLVEASKASSGCIHAVLRTVNVREIMGQALTEYGDRLAEHSIQPVVNYPDEALYATADGNLLWRVFDNLLSNACKYAQPGTRLYIDAKVYDGKVTISFRNTSSKPLNITADELMERFVRGDKSRSSEGSGLGLTIARSLTELQGGTFRLDIDCDLFKAIISLPHAEADVIAVSAAPAAEAQPAAELPAMDAAELPAIDTPEADLYEEAEEVITIMPVDDFPADEQEELFPDDEGSDGE